MRTWMTGCLLAVSIALAGCGQQPPAAGGDDAVASGASEHPGKQTYDRFCTSCHSMGAAGAPKSGDKAAWAPLIAKGIDTLVQSTITGKAPGMPAKGLCMSCSDADLRAAVEYMVEQAR